MSSLKSNLKKISSLVQSVHANEEEKSVNGLVELVEFLQSEEKEVLKAAIEGVCHVYGHIMEKDCMWLLPLSKTQDCCHGDILDQYRCWMREVYGQCQQQLLCLVLHPHHPVAELAIDAVFQLLERGGRGHQVVSSSYTFPNACLHSLVALLLEKTEDGKLLVEVCKKWLSYHDVLYHWLKNVSSVVSAKVDAKASSPLPNCFVANVYSALLLVSMPTSQQQLDSFLAGVPPTPQQQQHLDTSPTTLQQPRKSKSVAKGEAMLVLQKYRKQFSDAWLSFLRLPLPPCILREVLVNLHSSVMPHLLDPRLLLDFLTSAYNQKGVVSLLALNGLFILMNDFHLDYPSFYLKLYQLLSVSAFHVKYTARFIRLLNIFLSSTHLPLYLVAAFVKKLSRLALSAPPEAVVPVVVLVTNLIKRHPNLRVLLHRVDQDEYTFTSDPFDIQEPDPANSCALESCLWELQTLCSHYSPSVCAELETRLQASALTSRQEVHLDSHLATLKETLQVSFSDSSKAALNYKEQVLLWQ